jgi:hypothetical protein
MSGYIWMNTDPCHDKNRKDAGESDRFVRACSGGSVHDGGRNPMGILPCEGTPAGTLCEVRVSPSQQLSRASLD